MESCSVQLATAESNLLNWVVWGSGAYLQVPRYGEDGELPVLLVGTKKYKAALKGVVLDALTVEIEAWCSIINTK